MKNKGITLVALVITIIVLLILAGISIQAIINTGIFAQAENAKNLTEEKTAEENEILTNYLEQMNAIIGGKVTETAIDGAVVTPINDITTWLKTAGISKQYSYTTIEQVIADSTCIESLMNNENAMKYLARSTNFADTICENETAMIYLGQSAYVNETVLNNDIWVEKIRTSTYSYHVLNVPTNGLIREFLFENITADNKFKDTSGSGKDATIWGTITLEDGIVGKGARCSAARANNGIYTEGVGNMEQFSVSLWFKTYATNGRMIMSLFANGMYCEIEPIGNIFYFDSGNGAGNIGELHDGKWHHVCALITRDTTGIKQHPVYIDGVKKKCETYYSSGAASWNFISFTNDYRSMNSSEPWSANCAVDSVRVYNRILSENEVMALYAEGGDL